MRREDATCQQKALALTRRLKIKGMRLQRDEVLMHMRRLAEGAVGEIATGRLAAGGPRANGLSQNISFLKFGTIFLLTML
jgi:hypothetical protein